MGFLAPFGALTVAGVIGSAAIVVGRESRRLTDAYVLTLAAGLVVLVQPALIFGTRTATAALALGPLFLAIVLLADRPRRAIYRPLGLSLMAFICLLAAAMFRGAVGGVWRDSASVVVWSAVYASVAVFGALLMTTARTKQERDVRMRAVLLAPGVYVLANILLQSAPVTFPTTSLAAGTEATLLGGGFERVQFPISSGVNSMGAIAAVGLICATGLTWRHWRSWPLTVPLMLASIYAMAVSDSRFAIAVAVAGLAALPLLRRIQAARGLALLLPLSPLLMILLLGWLSENGVGASLSREGGSFATGTGRTEIWMAVWDHGLSSFNLRDVIGYGTSGQVPSGIYPYYAQVFDGSQEIFGVHNVYLQTIVDLGYAGLVLLVAALVLAIGSLARFELGQIAALGLVAMMLCGITEALPVSFPDTMVIFLLLATAGLVRRADGGWQETATRTS